MTRWQNIRKAFSSDTWCIILTFTAFLISRLWHSAPVTRIPADWWFLLLGVAQISLAGMMIFDHEKAKKPWTQRDIVNFWLPLVLLLLIAIIDRLINQSWLLG
ncbi:hypothetical protein [Schleiferilactobacillus shenzhenensis]|uniref:Uncharacterized protein n=1 Tax=Schleiferilactobacillus shenzhenensis LY-73 TaxID=1231336 RepID=U4TRY0_9LACO|nr:hypothetical protein [Schleiferilactobacillus shenzhenensis]ERL64247.1 hypothetical protein L248_1430 [Schleiferilactobacillus shenzhenensis LY-73]